MLSTSPQSQFDFALTFLRHQLQQQKQPVTSLRDDVSHSATESLLLAALGLAVPAAGTEATDRAASTAAEGQWSATGMTADSRRYKTELCRAYEERGQCRYGERCQFAHGVGELRAMERHPKYKTELCRTYHTSGYCPYGARCHFVHNGSTPPAPPPTPRDVDLHHCDGGFPAGRSNSMSGRTVPDSIQLTLLSAALEKHAASAPSSTRPAVNICLYSVNFFLFKRCFHYGCAARCHRYRNADSVSISIATRIVSDIASAALCSATYRSL